MMQLQAVNLMGSRCRSIRAPIVCSIALSVRIHYSRAVNDEKLCECICVCVCDTGGVMVRESVISTAVSNGGTTCP